MMVDVEKAAVEKVSNKVRLSDKDMLRQLWSIEVQ